MASLWERIVSAITAGYKAFNADELTPSLESKWADRTARLTRYEFLDSYRNQNPYRRQRADLYQFIRNIDNPADTVVDFYVGQVYGGTIKDDLEGGAIPIQTEVEALRPAITRLYRNSNWQTDKSLFVRHGATYGDVAVKLVDDRVSQMVNLEVLHPGKIHSVERDSQGWITYARIEYEQRVIDLTTGDTQSTYTYREDITPTEFRTFKDDKPFAYFQDALGRTVHTWRNDYGFVPLEVAQHLNVGLGWGVASFFYAIPIIDEINDAWSILNDSQRKAVNIIWAYFNKRTDLELTMSKRDNVPMIFLGAEGKPPFPMVPNIDITGAAGNIDRLNIQLGRKLPELQLNELRQSSNATAPGIRAVWSDAIDRVVQVRGSYDGSLVRLNKMGVLMGAMGNYPGFEAQRGIRLLADERLEHEIAERPVIEDSLSQQERITAMQAVANIDNPELARAILEELDLKASAIDAIVDSITETQERNARAAARGFAEGTFGDMDEAEIQEDQEDTRAATPAA